MIATESASAAPAIGDKFDHATGTYVVDWVCGCGEYDEGETCLGLSSDAMTWMGSVADLGADGFVRVNPVTRPQAAAPDATADAPQVRQPPVAPKRENGNA